MNKKCLNIICFFACVFSIGILNLFTENRNISDYENRTLEQFPEFTSQGLFSGDYFSGIEMWFADQFLLRDTFVQISSTMKEYKGLPGNSGAQIIFQDGFNAFEQQVAVVFDEAQVPYELSTQNSTQIPSAESQTIVPTNVPITQDSTQTGVNLGVQKDTLPLSERVKTEDMQNDSLLNESLTNGSLANESSPNRSLENEGLLNEGLSERSPNEGLLNDGLLKSSSNESLLNDSSSNEGLSEISQIEGLLNNNITNESLPALKPTPSEAASTTEKAPERDDNGRTIGKILIYKNSAMALFPFYAGPTAHYANTLNDFKEKAGVEIQTYSLLAPTNTEFIDNSKYKSLSDSQKEAIAYVNARLKGIIPVDAYTPISEHKDEYIYFRTDHHWTMLGAYYAYTGFAEAAGFEAVPLDTFETENIENYLGSMYDMTSSSTLRKHPDIITVYKPNVKNEYNVYYESPIKMKVIDMSHADKKIKYRVFISGDRPLGIIKTEVENGKKLLVIKDSYGNAMVPFLLPHYQEIFVIDPRQYNKNVFTLIKENGIQEVLFLNYVPILSEYGFSDLIVKMMEADN